ncbi:unnamed protein product, partial [Meganyctiphanes norvegica]
DHLKCFVCNNQFDEDKRRARTLPCAHHSCQDCLVQIINSTSPHYPICRAVISSFSVEMLPPNFLMDDLISKMNTGLHAMSLKGNGEDFSVGSCPKHKECQLYFTCKYQNISFEDELEETKKITITNQKTQMLSRDKISVISRKLSMMIKQKCKNRMKR